RVSMVSYTLSRAQDDILSLRSASSTPGFATQMELYDPDGNRLDGAVFGVSRKAPAAGTYTVIVGASSPRSAGGYAFAWQALNKTAGAVPLAGGGTTGGPLAGTARVPYFTAAGRARGTGRQTPTKTSRNLAP